MIVKDYKLVQQIGEGQFGSVYKAEHLPTKQFYAIKRIKNKIFNNDSSIKNEIELLKKLKHPNIVNFIEDFQHKGNVYIVLQYCGKGDLYQFMLKQPNIPELFAKNIIAGVINALDMLHSHKDKIVHRDLKLANILIDDKNQIKLADFGFSKNSEGELMKTYCGSPLTMAPEVLSMQKYDQRCDTWSLGIILYELLFKKPPFYPKGSLDPIGQLRQLSKLGKFQFGVVPISQECKKFIKRCLQPNVQKRPRVSQLLKDQWLSSGIRNTIRNNFFDESLKNIESKAQQMGRHILQTNVSNHLNELYQKCGLQKQLIRANLKCLNSYYKDQQIQRIYLSAILSILKKMSSITVQIDFSINNYYIKLTQIEMFNEYSRNLEKFINSQIKLRKIQIIENAGMERKLFEFIVDKSQQFFAFEPIEIDKAKMLTSLYKIYLGKIIGSVISISIIDEDQDLNAWLKGLSHEQIITIVNNPKENIIKQCQNCWITDQKFEIDPMETIQNLIGKKIFKAISLVYKAYN